METNNNQKRYIKRYIKNSTSKFSVKQDNNIILEIR